MRVYGGFSRALASVSPIGTIAPARGSEAMVAAGLAVYRNNVRAAYLRVLRDTFPVVARLVGDGFFGFLAHEYFHAHPPRSPLVVRYGEFLPEFLQAFEPASGLPYLPDVARLELAWLRAYHAADARSLPPDAVFDRIGADPDGARIVLHPSVALLRSQRPFYSIWLHNHEKQDAPLCPAATPEWALVARPDAEVVVTPLTACVYLTLERLAAGDRLGEAVGRASEGEPATSAADVLKTVLCSGVIISATMESDTRP